MKTGRCPWWYRLAPETAVSTLHALLDRRGLQVIAAVSTEDPSALLLRQPVRLAPETAVSTLHALLDRRGLQVIAAVSTEDPSALLLRQLKAQRGARGR